MTRRCSTDGIEKRCAGSCAAFELCDADADPSECRRALRCRELKDEKSDCASRVTAGSCLEQKTAGYLLKHCHLSCARNDLDGLMRRFRTKLTVRTRKHGLLDDDVRRRTPGARLLPLGCWSETAFDERPAATCASARARLLRRWRRRARRCSALVHTTPRAPPRRALPIRESDVGVAEAPQRMSVLPLAPSEVQRVAASAPQWWQPSGISASTSPPPARLAQPPEDTNASTHWSHPPLPAPPLADASYTPPGPVGG